MALKNYKETHVAASTEGGSSVDFKTGSWRVNRPVVDRSKCIHCMMCYLCCPDNSITIIKESERLKGNPEVTGIDLDHCKGCGLCAAVCPVKCIKIVKEDEAMKEDKK